MATSVWVGFDQPGYLGRRESGAGAALPIWVNHMREVLKDYPEAPAVVPPGITTAFISSQNAELTNAQDPDGYWEYFAVGTQPGRSKKFVSGQGELQVVTPARTDTDTEVDSEELF